MEITVCMATYNGEKFIERQIETILAQISPDDEIIIVDDCSSDSTIQRIRRFNDPRIVIYFNDRNQREVYSFSRAISLAKGDIIFLADQDDVWTAGRVALMKRRLRETGASLLTSNFDTINELEEPLSVQADGVDARSSAHHLRNIVDIFIGKTNYFGCAMAFHRTLVPLIVPIPRYVESHDLWIALAANSVGSNLHIDDKTLLKRRHRNNTTKSNRSFFLKLNARAIFVLSLIVLRWRQILLKKK